jgi:hypothetical protein
MKPGETVEVDEVVQEVEGGVVVKKGRIRPGGWIDLLRLKDEFRWAKKVMWSREQSVGLERTWDLSAISTLNAKYFQKSLANLLQKQLTN